MGKSKEIAMQIWCFMPFVISMNHHPTKRYSFQAMVILLAPLAS